MFFLQSFDNSTTNNLVKVRPYIGVKYLENIIDYYIFQNYNIDENHIHDYDYSINSIFRVCLVIHNESELCFNINKNKKKTFPRQIYNRYDYFAVFYKRQIHKMMIRKWRDIMYRPNSKYFLKLKNHFEKIEKMEVFGR